MKRLSTGNEIRNHVCLDVECHCRDGVLKKLIKVLIIQNFIGSKPVGLANQEEGCIDRKKGCGSVGKLNIDIQYWL